MLNLKLSVSQTVRRTEIQCFYQVYSEKRPRRITITPPFYLGISYTKNPTEKPWFKVRAVGVNMLNGAMKTMADKLGFDI